MKTIQKLRIKRIRVQSKQYARIISNGNALPRVVRYFTIPFNPINKWSYLWTNDWRWKVWYFSFQYITLPLRYGIYEKLLKFLKNNVFVLKYHFIKET